MLATRHGLIVVPSAWLLLGTLDKVVVEALSKSKTRRLVGTLVRQNLRSHGALHTRLQVSMNVSIDRDQRVSRSNEQAVLVSGIGTVIGCEELWIGKR